MRTQTRHSALLNVTKVALFAATALVLTALVIAAYTIKTDQANAAGDRLGTPQVTLNPGGGILANGTDGLRFTVNLDENYTDNDDDGDYNYGNEGQDGVVYRGTYQYCCSAGSPMLNIGGTLYGQAGPAYSSDDWSSIQIIATSGASSVGARTSTTGDSTATIRYTVVRGELTYSIDRTVSYYYPNDYVTDSYSFVIPAGNTDQVKFYTGGDTAPGSSDQGYGIMLTEPVRSVISLNTSSQIMFGFREIQGSRTFDGATSQSFYTPYSTVQAGEDIGYVVQPSNHDAGLMMQWNLGSTPGTYTGAFEQFSTLQATNLNATLAESYSDIAGVVDLNISIVNTELDPVTGLGYTLTLPAGLLIESTVTSGCGGTLTATPGSGVVTLTGVDLSAASNCVVSVPVSAEVAGLYTVSNLSVSNLQGVLTNNVGTSRLHVGVYSLTYATQGGTSIDEVVREPGYVTTIPTTTRTGHTFIEWNTQPDGSGTSYDSGDSYTIPGNNSTLYAIWQHIPYSVTYNTQGGNAVAAQTNLVAGSDIEISSESERSGYQFVEWNTLADGTGQAYYDGDLFTVPGQNTTLYAIWIREITVTFDGQYDEFLETQTDLVGETVWTPYAPDRDGFEFVGWNTESDGSGTYYEEDVLLTIPSNDMTLYGIWDDKDGVSIIVENGAPNNGDGNNDGVADADQTNVTSFINPETSRYITLAVDEACMVTNAASVTEPVATDGEYTYPAGLIDFTIDCGTPGYTATIEQYYYGVTGDEFIVRKYDATTQTYVTITDATTAYVTSGGVTALKATYQVTDGGVLDADGEENGEIVDPAGIAVSNAVAAGAPNTGINAIGTSAVLSSLLPALASVLLLSTAAVVFFIRAKR